MGELPNIRFWFPGIPEPDLPVANTNKHIDLKMELRVQAIVNLRR